MTEALWLNDVSKNRSDILQERDTCSSADDLKSSMTIFHLRPHNYTLYSNILSRDLCNSAFMDRYCNS